MSAARFLWLTKRLSTRRHGRILLWADAAETKSPPRFINHPRTVNTRALARLTLPRFDEKGRKSRSSMAIVRQHLPGRATFDKIGGKCPRGAIGCGEKSQLKTYGECSASCRVQDKELFQQLLAIGRHVEGDSVLSAQHALSQFLTRKNAQSC